MDARAQACLAHAHPPRLPAAPPPAPGQASEAEHLTAAVASLSAAANRLPALRADKARLAPMAAEVHSLEASLRELRQLEGTRGLLQVRPPPPLPGSTRLLGQDASRKGVVRWAGARARARSQPGRTCRQGALAVLSAVAPRLVSPRALGRFSNARGWALPVAALPLRLTPSAARSIRPPSLGAAPQAEAAGLQPAVVAVERLRKQVAAFKADAAAAEHLQEQVAALSPVAEQLPGLKALYAKLQVGGPGVEEARRGGG